MSNLDKIVLPTPVDNIHASMYAMDRVKKERCNDTDITTIYPGIQWQLMEENRMYPCPSNITNCEHGKCRIITATQCLAESQVPFNTDGNGFKSNDCKKDTDCKNLDYDPAICNNNKCQPRNPYLEWNTDINKCVYGNFALRQWCDYPKQRRTIPEKGITNVPPFNYIPGKSKCQITKEYCEWMGVEYTEKDDKGRPNCYETAGQSVAEFVLGKTIFRDLKKITENFQTIPHNIVKIADRKKAKKYEILSKDFGGTGIHLYQIFWSDKTTSGFFSDEIKEIYPELIIKKNNIEFININIEQVKKNPKLKRIYLVSGSGNWITDSIFTAGIKK